MDYQMKQDYDAILKEYVDLNDIDTLHTVMSLTEAGQNQLLVSLTDQLYQKIVEKVDDIDFGTIPKSNGDITRVENYESNLECLNIIRDIVKQYGQSQEPIDTILTAIYNIRDRQKLFNKCFAFNIELGQIIYNSMTMACIASTSYMIQTSIDFIKSPTDETFEVSMDKVAYQKTMNSMMYNDLRKFNAACKRGEIDKILNDLSSAAAKKFSGIGVAAGVGAALFIAIPLLKTILPMIQDIVYLIYYSSQSISDYWAAQADLLQMNTSTIIYRQDISDDKKKKIIEKQNKIAERMRKVSNTFAINIKKGEKETKKAIDNDAKKYIARKKDLSVPKTAGDMDAAMAASSSPLF